VSDWSFDWHNERTAAGGRESFLYWLVIMSISPLRTEQPDIYARISEATSRLTDVRITMQINGIDVDAEHFIARIEQNMKDSRSWASICPRRMTAGEAA
jgi:hypothetical protein